MSFPEHVWKQLRSLSTDELVAALLKDGFLEDTKLRTERIYRHPDGRKVSIHYHTGKTTYGSKLLKELLEDIGWTESHLRRLKLVK